jgi:hypothetical protein
MRTAHEDFETVQFEALTMGEEERLLSGNEPSK